MGEIADDHYAEFEMNDFYDRVEVPMWRQVNARIEMSKRAGREPKRCPTCDSPDPSKHPAMQFEGEVQVCRDGWHLRAARGAK